MSVEPGQTCPTCDRRVAHPKKETTPKKTQPFHYHAPADEGQAHKDVQIQAAKHVGCYERPYWQFWLNTYAYAAVLQDESLKGVAHREPA